MKLTTANVEGIHKAAILEDERRILIETINEVADKNWSTSVFDLIRNGEIEQLTGWYRKEGRLQQNKFPALEIKTTMEPLYRRPEKILGVGMNYLEKAIELSGHAPQADPVFFLKPESSLIGPGEVIQLPAQSAEVTAEAELAVVIGKTCKRVSETEAASVIAGFTTTLDMTAKDIHRRDPRYLQRSKSFDTFFSLGDTLHTLDEYDDWKEITVETIKNGEVVHRNQVGRMIYSIPFIVSFFSEMMTLKAGDIIMTGTPGSVLIQENDQVGCSITGFTPMVNGVSKEYAEITVR